MMRKEKRRQRWRENNLGKGGRDQCRKGTKEGRRRRGSDGGISADKGKRKGKEERRSGRIRSINRWDGTRAEDGGIIKMEGGMEEE